MTASSAKPKAIERLADLSFDPRNANLGTQRGAGMLESSLRNFGAGRSILADRDGVVLAGNKTLEQAAALGIDIQTVHSDGTKLVVVIRDDVTIDDAVGRNLAIADNRVGQVDLAWDGPMLAALMGDGLIDGGDFWFPEELAAVLDAAPDDTGQAEAPDPRSVTCPACGESFDPRA